MYFLWTLVVFLMGCDAVEEGGGFDEKTENSILQHYEYKYRSVENNRGYMIISNELGSDVDILAFPIKGSSKGYVVMLPKSKRGGAASIPETDFVVTSGELAEIKSKVVLSEMTERYILDHVR